MEIALTGVAPRTNETWNCRSAFVDCAAGRSRYFTASKWAIRHETHRRSMIAARDNRPVAVEIAVRRDKEMQANAGMIKLPVAILNHGNTVKHTEYSFLANTLRRAAICRSARSMICRPIRRW